MLLLDVYLRMPIFTPTTDVTGCSLHTRQQLTLLNDVTCLGTLINKAERYCPTDGLQPSRSAAGGCCKAQSSSYCLCKLFNVY